MKAWIQQRLGTLITSTNTAKFVAARKCRCHMQCLMLPPTQCRSMRKKYADVSSQVSAMGDISKITLGMVDSVLAEHKLSKDINIVSCSTLTAPHLQVHRLVLLSLSLLLLLQVVPATVITVTTTCSCCTWQLMCVSLSFQTFSLLFVPAPFLCCLADRLLITG